MFHVGGRRAVGRDGECGGLATGPGSHERTPVSRGLQDLLEYRWAHTRPGSQRPGNGRIPSERGLMPAGARGGEEKQAEARVGSAFGGKHGKERGLSRHSSCQR